MCLSYSQGTRETHLSQVQCAEHAAAELAVTDEGMYEDLRAAING